MIDLCKLNPELVAQIKADTSHSTDPPTPAPDKVSFAELIQRPTAACSQWQHVGPNV